MVCAGRVGVRACLRAGVPVCRSPSPTSGPSPTAVAKLRSHGSRALQRCAGGSRRALAPAMLLGWWLGRGWGECASGPQALRHPRLPPSYTAELVSWYTPYDSEESFYT